MPLQHLTVLHVMNDVDASKDLFVQDRLYTVREVAVLLRVSRSTIVRAILSRRLEALRVGRQWRIRGEDGARYVREQTVRSFSE